MVRAAPEHCGKGFGGTWDLAEKPEYFETAVCSLPLYGISHSRQANP